MPFDLDLDRLLAPIAPEAPSGRDLRYEGAFEALRAAAQLEFGEVDAPGGHKVWGPRARDFRKIRQAALELLRTGRDLRVQVWLAAALAATEGPPGLAAGLQLIRRTLAEHWNNLHPALDLSESSPADQAAVRLNALRALTSPEDMLAEVGRMRLLEVGGRGAVRLRDWDLASDRSAPLAYETKPERSSVEAALRAAPPDLVAEQLEALAVAAGEVAAIDDVLAGRIADAGALPNLSPLASVIERMRALLAQHAPATEAGGSTATRGEGTVADQGEAQRPSPSLGAAGGLPARVDSREDVVRALDLAIDYYRRREPGSPVPLLLERAKRMVGMGFLDVMAELTPDAMKRLADLLGTQK